MQDKKLVTLEKKCLSFALEQFNNDIGSTTDIIVANKISNGVHQSGFTYSPTYCEMVVTLGNIEEKVIYMYYAQKSKFSFTFVFIEQDGNLTKGAVFPEKSH